MERRYFDLLAICLEEDLFLLQQNTRSSLKITDFIVKIELYTSSKKKRHFTAELSSSYYLIMVLHAVLQPLSRFMRLIAFIPSQVFILCLFSCSLLPAFLYFFHFIYYHLFSLPLPWLYASFLPSQLFTWVFLSLSSLYIPLGIVPIFSPSLAVSSFLPRLFT